MKKIGQRLNQDKSQTLINYMSNNYLDKKKSKEKIKN